MMKATLCSLIDSPNLEHYLIDLLNVSKTFLKKSNISKNYLEKRIFCKDEISLPLEILNKGKVSFSYKGEEVKVIKNEERYLAISKPVRVHTHPLSYEEDDNLLSWCRSKGHFRVLNINQEKYDRGLAYRLDYETSGVMLLLKNEKDHSWLRDNFKSAAIRKIYVAIIEGELEDGVLTHRLSRSGNKIKENPREKEVSLEIKTLAKNNNLSLVRVSLKQGIRHQIRAQLSLKGCPILGDVFYGGKENIRVFLHAFYYHFECPWGEIKVEDSIPLLFESLLDLDGSLKVLSD